MAYLQQFKPFILLSASMQIATGITIAGLITLTNHAYGSDDIANERPPVNAKSLQAHWNVDCKKVHTKLVSASSHHNALSSLLNDTDQLHEELLLCSIIHDRFWKETSPCNHYKLALNWYKSNALGNKKAFTDLDQNSLADALNCKPKS